MNDGARIGYSEFVAICHVDDPRDFCGFRLELDGLYVFPPRADDLITPKDRAVLSWHPTGDHSKPALPLPCTIEQLRAFVAEAGLLGSIDEDEVDALPVGASDAIAGTTADSLHNGVPGKLPNTAMGKLAMAAAWQIEIQTERSASAKQVVTLLQEWADGGKEPGTLLKSDKQNSAVIWITGKGKTKSFDIGACEKALETWMKSRA
jgi:hypothetical protein